MYNGLNDFVRRLEAEGELCRVATRVDTECEIAEITDRISKSAGGGKALLFENTDSGFHVLTNMMGSDRRMALALGVDSLDDLSERIDKLLKEAVAPKSSLMDKLRMLPMLAEMSRWFPRTSNSRGECQQVILTGDSVDMSLLPVLKCWGCDGGAFVTLPMVNTVDPVTGIRNVGMYRMQIFDSKTTGMHWHTHKTGARHYDGYKKLGRRMPVSVALGGDPAYTYSATAPMPDNMDEYLLAGFIRRKPVKLVKCITNDIYVPSDCDFVIEGYVDSSEKLVVEGPFGDHTGFYSLEDLYPQFHITAITHRRDAIYPATVVGVPPQEDAYIAKATERIFLAPIRLAVQPEVCDMTMPDMGTAHNIAIVSIENRYRGQAVKVAQGLWGAGQMMFNKYMLVTAADVDVRDEKMLARLMRRVDIDRDIVRSEGILDVLDHATATNGFGGKLAFDLTGIDVNSIINIPVVSDSYCTKWLEQWGCVVVFVDADVVVRGIDGVKYIAIFDRSAETMTGRELLWLAAANTDPRRDVSADSGSLIIDARSKPSHIAANPSRFPNVVTSLPQTVALVDERWSEYRLGEFVKSPSLHYGKLRLSNKAQW